MTGRGAGYCAGYAIPAGYAGGFGCGFGYGHGSKRMIRTAGRPGPRAYQVYAGAEDYAFDETAFLSSRKAFLEHQLEQVKQRISDLSDKSE